MAEIGTLAGRAGYVDLNLSGLGPLVIACKYIDPRIKTLQFTGGQGSVSVGDRGLEVSFARYNGEYSVGIFHRGDKGQAADLHTLILKYIPKD